MLMSAVAGDAASRVSAQVARRWQAIDPLLPVPAGSPPDCGAELIAAGADGQPMAIGICEHWVAAPGSMDLTWGAAQRFQLTVRLTSPDVTNALDNLLSLWRDHLADLPGADDEDTAAVVTWPSRDIDGVAALLRHGLAPLAVIAARTTRSAGAADVPAGTVGGPAGTPSDPAGTGSRGGGAQPSLRIRRAGPADIDAVVRLGLEVIRYDAHFGSVVERPGTADALRDEAAGLLAMPEPWIWLADRDDTPIGLLYAERPESAGWIAPMVRPAPVAYLTLMFVLPGERGTGVSAALAARFHEEVEAAGVAVTLLHYEQVNPLSAPFWSRQGYRPLWTTWETSPALAIR
jgi:GNAT superfamily N-acetyltransferase